MNILTQVASNISSRYRISRKREGIRPPTYLLVLIVRQRLLMRLQACTWWISACTTRAATISEVTLWVRSSGFGIGVSPWKISISPEWKSLRVDLRRYEETIVGNVKPEGDKSWRVKYQFSESRVYERCENIWEILLGNLLFFR